MIRILSLSFPVLAVLLSCAAIPQEDVGEYISHYGNPAPEPSHFALCYNHGCSGTLMVSLNSDQWNEARNVFQPPPENSKEERQRISLSIGVLETLAGKATGTGKFGGIKGWVPGNKFDCIDDAVNTGTYLYMLRNDGLIRFHELRGAAHRGFLIDGRWPHVATVIVEKETGDAYVVDSWFLDNGNPAFVIPYSEWFAGWKPVKPQNNPKLSAEKPEVR
ncbi:MAG TPA: hypothetical protein VMB78_07395 [Dissulfurispiraceae bacterium]|nr:hypothetical protein [Dissulfurispiraceae bacterium]